MTTSIDTIFEQRRPQFSREVKAVYMRKNYNGLFLNKSQYPAIHPILERDDDWLISVDDFNRIYAPDMTIVQTEDTIQVGFKMFRSDMPPEQIARQWYFPQVPQRNATLKLNSLEIQVDGQRLHMGQCPCVVDGQVYLPIIGMMSQGFGAKVVRRNTMAAITFFEDMEFSVVQFRYYSSIVRGRSVGDIYESFWFEEGQRVIPYHAYIPTTYRSDVPNKALIYFHGGGGSEDRCFEQTNDAMQRFAEDRGYIVIGLNGYIRSSFFGSLVPIIQTIDLLNPETVDYNNPEGWPVETVCLRETSMKCTLQSFEVIFKRWNLDRKNLFAMGNSAGSVACMHASLHYPGFFNAICPTGGFINYNFYDLEEFQKRNKDNHMLSVVGTEDAHGFDYMLRAYEKLDEMGIQYRKCIVGGGDHPSAWVYALKEIFDFYDSNIVH